MATKKFSEYAIQGNNVTLTYDNVNDTVTFDVNVDKNDVGLGNVNNTSDLNKPISTATQTALNAKQDSLGFTAENVANKSISVTTDQASNTKYPSVKSVYDWAVGTFQPILGFTPVTNARTLTINGTTYDLSANRTWSVGDLVSTGSYANPTWLTSLAWGKITSTPTTLSGYGITDAVPSSRTLTINGTTYDLSADRSWTITTATPTLAQVTTAGNTTTNSISVGGLTVATNLIYTDTVNSRIGIGTTSPTNILTIQLTSNANNNNQGISIKKGSGFFQLVNGTGSLTNFVPFFIGQPSYDNYGLGFQGNLYSTISTNPAIVLSGADNTGSTTIGNGQTILSVRNYSNPLLDIKGNGNVLINTTTDAGYKLDVNGTLRVSGNIYLTNAGSYIGQPSSSQISIYVGGSARLNVFSTQIETSLVANLNGGANIKNIVTNGSITASSALAQGVYFNNTLVAAANNDVLVGLDINPTFTNGAFTGVSNIGVRVQKGTLRLASISADPTTAANGDMYYNTTSNTFKVYQGGAWKTITAI